jgi:carbon-monoxide dehydrogenase medium subunit
MYAVNFDYYRASSLADIRSLMKAHPGAKLLAGGHSLIPLLKLRLAAPSAVIDIGRVAELRGVSRKGDALAIGALTTHAEIASSADVRTGAPALADAAAIVGDPAVRNRGTIGGNIAHADPASDLPTVLVALDATMVAAGPGGERTIPAGEFFQGLMTTALAEDEILTTVLVPGQGAGQGSAYVKFPHPASRYAVIGVAVSVTAANGTCTGAKVAIGGLVSAARRCPSVEAALAGKAATDATISEAASRVGADLGGDVMGDIYASAEYRASVAPVYVQRAIAAALARGSLSKS